MLGGSARRFRSPAACAVLVVGGLSTIAGWLPVSPAAALPPPPTAAQCAAVRAHRSLPPAQAFDPRPGAPRVFAIQFKQDLANVVTYAAFRTKIECLIRDWVVPHLAAGRPNVVAFNEDVGLMTIATGTRGAAARRLFGGPGGPSCEGQGAPCATLAALAAVTAAYGPQIAAYHQRFPAMGSVSQAFVGATDTMVRSFMTTFSDMAKRYGIYILGSNDQAPFEQSTSPADIALFSDPDQPRPSSVYVATSPEVYNQVFMWGPHDVRATGPDVLRNLVATNRKVPLTPIENELQFAPGPSTGPAAIDNLRPYQLPGSSARIGFATSLPAFTYGNPPPGTDPCSDTSQYYMRCLNQLGANLVIQDEANPGRWTGPDGDGIEQWQPMSWMTSTWRTAADPSVAFSYNVTPMMVGNLADLAFDGQSAITQRGLQGSGCHYIGNAAFIPGEDRPDVLGDAGAKSEFVALAPWVARDGPRSSLRQIGAALAPGSGTALENDYLETALIADLPVPPDPRRAGCVEPPNLGLASEPGGLNGLGPAPGPRPGAGACTSRRRIVIHLPRRRGRARRVRVVVDGRSRILHGARRRIRISLAGLHAGRVRVRLEVRLRGGGRYVLSRSYRTCRPARRR